MLNIFILLALIGGIFLPLQALINARLASEVTSSVWAAFISFTTGTIILAIYLAVSRTPAPNLHQLTTLPVWMFSGGLLGAFFVVMTTMTVPRLGAAALISLIILGQMASSLLLDNFGFLQDNHAVSLERLIGAGLILAGTYLVVYR